MEYRAVGNRCAVVLAELHLPIPKEEVLAILSRKGFSVVEVDLIKLARDCVGSSKYRRGAKLTEAPDVFDCSSFIKWLYGECGIWLPRRSVQQSECGERVKLEDITAGDVIFTSSKINYYRDDPALGIGHVGIATNEWTVVHAANKRVDVIESSMDKFIGKDEFRVARRYIPKNTEVITLETPKNRGVEIADDIRWIVLQSLT